jgi:hypothetical protein
MLALLIVIQLLVRLLGCHSFVPHPVGRLASFLEPIRRATAIGSVKGAVGGDVTTTMTTTTLITRRGDRFPRLGWSSSSRRSIEPEHTRGSSSTINHNLCPDTYMHLPAHSRLYASPTALYSRPRDLGDRDFGGHLNLADRKVVYSRYKMMFGIYIHPYIGCISSFDHHLMLLYGVEW